MQELLFETTDPQLGDVEAWCLDRGLQCVVGVDEAGRGPLAGPVHAAAVVLAFDRLDDDWVELLDDSKKLTAEERDHAYGLIKEHSIAWAVASSCNETIDDINILQATLRAMEAAIDRACARLDRPPDRVFVDGNTRVMTTLPQQPIIGGDASSLHIAAASILAKVERDREMIAFHERWPEYNFASNKGYPTAEHRRAIADVGPCAIHRLSFGGVREHQQRLRAD